MRKPVSFGPLRRGDSLSVGSAVFWVVTPMGGLALAVFFVIHLFIYYYFLFFFLGGGLLCVWLSVFWRGFFLYLFILSYVPWVVVCFFLFCFVLWGSSSPGLLLCGCLSLGYLVFCVDCLRVFWVVCLLSCLLFVY